MNLEDLLIALGHDHFRALTNHVSHWSISHLSFDGVSIAEICDKNLDRLLEQWAQLTDSIDIYNAKNDGEV